MAADRVMATNRVVQFNGYTFDRQSKELLFNDETIPLQPKHADLLDLFLSQPGDLISREQIRDEVWGNRVLEHDQSINFSIKCLRQSLKDNPKQPTFIQTIPKRGYKFIAEVSYQSDTQHSDNFSSPLMPSGNEHKNSHNVIRKNYSQNTYYSPQLKSLIISAIFIIPAVFWWHIVYKDKLVTTQAPSSALEANELSTDLKRALYLFDKADYQSRLRSIELLKEIIIQKPTSHIAHAYLSMSHSLTAGGRNDFILAREYMELAKHYANDSPETLMADALLSFYDEWNIPKAHKQIKTVASQRPDWSLAWHELAVTSSILKDYSQAKESIDKLLEISPGVAQERYHAGWFYRVIGDKNKALEQCRQSVEINPKHHYSMMCAASVANELGLHQMAIRYYMMVVDDLADENLRAELSIKVKSKNYQAFYQWFLSYQIENQYPSFWLALTYANLELYDKSFEQLQLAADTHNNMLPTAWAFSEFAPIRDTDRFKEIMTAVKR